VSTAARTFSPDPSSVPAARRFVTQTLLLWQLPAAAEAAELLVSEICTNAVLHARTAYTVELARGEFGDGDVVRVRVTDSSSALPRQRTYEDDSTTGRGIRLVDALSTRWGVERVTSIGGRGPGKVVFFDIPVAGDAGGSSPGWGADADTEDLLARFAEPDELPDQPPRIDRDSAWRQRRAA
jgi:anti-sigma regulatory factor (Ser/Thr protein kinase)